MKAFQISIKFLMTAALFASILSFDVKESAAAQFSAFDVEITPPGGDIDKAGFFGLLIDDGAVLRYNVSTGQIFLATGDEPIPGAQEVPGRIFSDSFGIRTQGRDGFYNPLFCFDLDPTGGEAALSATDLNGHLIIGGVPGVVGSGFFLDEPLAYRPTFKQIAFSAPSSGACFYRAYNITSGESGDFGLFGVSPDYDDLTITYEVPSSVVVGGTLNYQRVIINNSAQDLDVYFQETFPANPAVFTAASFSLGESEVRGRVTIPAGQSVSSGPVSRAVLPANASPGQYLDLYFAAAARDSAGAILAASEHRRVLVTAADANQSQIMVTPNEPLEANGQASAQISVTVRDAQGAPVGAQPVALVISGEVGDGGLDNSALVSDSAGQASTQLTSTRSGTVAVTAHLGTTSADPEIGTVSVQFVAGQAVGLAFTSPDTDLAAGTNRELQIEVVDAFGNRVPGDQGTVVELAQSGGEGSVLNLGQATTVQGVAIRTITGDQAGLVTISASTSGLEGGDSTTSFEVIPGTATELKFIVVPEVLDSDETDIFSVELRDVRGNRATNDSGTSIQFVQVDGYVEGDGSVAGLGSVASVEGVATISLTGIHAGSVTIEAISGDLSPDSASFEVRAGSPYSLEFVDAPSSILVDDTQDFRIELQDINGNLVSMGCTIVITLPFVSSNPGIVEMPTGNIGLFDGKVDIPVTGVSPGPVKFLAENLVGCPVAPGKTSFSVTSAP